MTQTYCWSLDEESYEGDCADIDEALGAAADAISTGNRDEELPGTFTVSVGRSVPVPVPMPRADDLIDGYWFTLITRGVIATFGGRRRRLAVA